MDAPPPPSSDHRKETYASLDQERADNRGPAGVAGLARSWIDSDFDHEFSACQFGVTASASRRVTLWNPFIPYLI